MSDSKCSLTKAHLRAGETLHVGVRREANRYSPFFFLLGPFVLTSVVTCSTSGSSVFSTDIVRISRFFGSHFRATWPKFDSVSIAPGTPLPPVVVVVV